MRKTVEFAMLVAMVAAAFPALAQDKPILAVMEIEDKTGKFERKDLEAATEVLSALLVASGKYSVADKGRQAEKRRKVVRKLRRESHDPCYDDKCKIELGRELAADSLLSCVVVGLGKRCTLSCSMVPLEKAVSDEAGIGEFDCSTDALSGAVKSVAEQLAGKRTAGETRTKVKTEPAQPATFSGKAGIEWVYSKPAGIHFAKTETTVVQYRACVEAGTCEPEHHKTRLDNKYCNWGYWDRDNHPMNCVAWYGAEAFCSWADGRLPTEDEWYAEASNGGTLLYPWGSADPTCVRCIMDDGKTTGAAGSETDGCGEDRTWPVCSKTAGNSLSGLCDMSGNLWEWTSTPEDRARVLRGGTWDAANPEALRASARTRGAPEDWFRYSLGFRCVRDAP